MAQTLDEGRAQLIANLQQQAEELAQLNRIAVALSSEFDLQRLLQMMTDAARKLTSAQYATFFLIPEITGANTPANKAVFTLAAISGATERIAAHFRHLGPVEGLGLLQPVFWGEASVLVDDVLTDPRYVGMPRGHIPVRSFLGVRLRTREGASLGAFLIGDNRPGRFSTRHFELVQALGAQAAVAIHNSRARAASYGGSCRPVRERSTRAHSRIGAAQSRAKPVRNRSATIALRINGRAEAPDAGRRA